MEKLIARVTAASGRAPLTRLITAPLGLDVWEVQPDHLVVQADEAQAARLEAMGYGVEQLVTTESFLSDFFAIGALVISCEDVVGYLFQRL